MSQKIRTVLDSLKNIKVPSTINTVSFDIFDTLLVRSYVKPKDLFIHIETISEKAGFAKERIAAEERSRDSNLNAGTRETTFEEIYEEIDSRYRDNISLERELERNSVPYLPILEFYKKVQKEGKRIVLISDMYLPSEFVTSLLEKNGITGFEKLYISCENGTSKRTGGLFRKALDDLEIRPEEMLHIGDNPHSDVKVPESLSIHTMHVPKLIDIYFKHHKAAHRFYRKDPCLERSIIVALDAIHWMENGFKEEKSWKNISFRFGGPAVYDYCRFIHEQDPVNHLMFVARDGYNLQKAYKILFGDSQKTSYIYAPRIANILAGSKFENYRNYKQTLLSKICGIDCSTEEAEKLFEEHRSTIDHRRKEIFSALQNNIRHRTDGADTVTLVDVTTLKYSSQELISELLSDVNVRGVYYFVLDNRNTIPHTGYSVRTSMLNLGDNVNIVEFFMTSPEPPVEGIDDNGEPIFKKVSSDEKMRLDIYNQVTEGEVQYTETVRRIFGEYLPCFGRKAIASWISTLVYHSDRDVRTMLADMKWPVDANHDKYVSMTFHPRDSWYHLRKKTLDMMWFVSTLIKK